jgi:histidinol-phosphate aminotransferase
LFVVDEAYLPFAFGLESTVNCSADNVFVLRSMTKDFALAGLRLGYAVGNAKLMDSLRRVLPPWSVNAVAQAAGVAASRDTDRCRRSLERLAVAKDDLVQGLTRLGLTPLPSAVHFFLVPCNNAAALRLVLLKRGVLVRDCASFGLTGYLRIATRLPEENERLLTVLREVL